MNARLRPRASVPRLGFLGVGWIGRQRMQVLAESGAGEVVAVCDPSGQACTDALACARGARRVPSLEALLDGGIDGLVIATPSAVHASQAIAALERGIPVYCQKPLARTAGEAARVVDAARRADCLLGVDFSYRHVAGVGELRELVHSGALGELRAIDLAFHNAYGPDKPWFRDMALSGGGCVMDLGTHLVDLALWITGAERLDVQAVHLRAGDRVLATPVDAVEDYAAVQGSVDGASVRLACSWNLQAGCEAVIGASFFGSRGGAALRNVDGSFYDFTVEHFQGTRSVLLAGPPDAWGGRGLVQWTERLACRPGFDDACEQVLAVARTVDAIYGR